ncbi:MAG: Holliday junction resolvase Hjc [Candidatus Marsarchaeota archaeon]|nr:Holliday junction resolvase Hjc [Candidatus Marsarchaeota archaeon]
MHRYVKGARSERELINAFYEKNFSVMRSAGSGVNSLSPDIIVFRGGKGYAFECKAWNRSSLSIEREKYEVLKRWEANTKMNTFIAWRMNSKGWFFIKLDEMKKTEKNYTVTKSTAMGIGRNLGSIIADSEYLEGQKIVLP